MSSSCRCKSDCKSRQSDLQIASLRDSISKEKVKFFELRDKMTFVPIVCVSCSIAEKTLDEQYLLRQAGYSEDNELILLTDLRGNRPIDYNCSSWQDRTFKTAHEYIQKNWKCLQSGSVIDVEYILGESDVPKVSERFCNINF